MLDGACDYVLARGRKIARQTENREIVRLRSAARKHKLVRGCAEELRDRYARLLQPLPRELACRVCA